MRVFLGILIGLGITVGVGAFLPDCPTQIIWTEVGLTP